MSDHVTVIIGVTNEAWMSIDPDDWPKDDAGLARALYDHVLGEHGSPNEADIYAAVDKIQEARRRGRP